MKDKKNWTEIKTNDSWAIFKIMSEFVEGYEKMAAIGPCVAIYGSARTKVDNPYYDMAYNVSKKLSDNGYGVITGGGPGIMEAGNKGASEGSGVSVGLSITLPFETGYNEFISPKHCIEFDYFFVRKVIFVKYSQAFVVMPGGLGTIDELFETLTLIQTGKINKRPVVLMGKDYWGGLIDWIKSTMLFKENNISEKDLDLFIVTDDVEECYKYINDFYKENPLSPNF